jgi:hypothetical protein
MQRQTRVGLQLTAAVAPVGKAARVAALERARPEQARLELEPAE